MARKYSEIDWTTLRLKDRIRPGVRVLFVGINPGVRSAITGHHFAGFSNRFWKLLYESGLVPEPITWKDDERLPEFGYGITNLIARPSPGIDDLKPAEYVDGWRVLERKIKRYRPEIVALVGVTLYRAILPLLAGSLGSRGSSGSGSGSGSSGSGSLGSGSLGSLGSHRAPLAMGWQRRTVHGAGVFVLPNPSGRNANFSYQEMLDAFRALRRALEGRSAGA